MPNARTANHEQRTTNVDHEPNTEHEPATEHLEE